MFKIDIDAGRRLVSVVISGMLSEAEASDYVAAIRSQFVRSIGTGPYVMMIDSRFCTLQSQTVIETFAKHIAGFPKAEKIALVNGDSLARMQLRRILTRDYACFFHTPDEALAWLFDPAAADCRDSVRRAAAG